MRALGDAEFEIMEVLWNEDEPVTVSYITKHLKTRNHWPISTVLTVLSRMEEKGIIECDRTRRKNLYQAVMSEKEYKNAQTKLVVNKLYHSSLAKMVANWVEDEGISEEDLSELEAVMKHIKDKKK